jgi:hypothetical protein
LALDLWDFYHKRIRRYVEEVRSALMNTEHDDAGELTPHSRQMLIDDIERARNAFDRMLLEVQGTTDPAILAQPLEAWELAKIEKSVEGVTEGPWQIEEGGPAPWLGSKLAGGIFIDYKYTIKRRGQVTEVKGFEPDQTWCDAEFTAHAREYIPQLLTEVRRLRAWDLLLKQPSTKEDNQAKDRS